MANYQVRVTADTKQATKQLGALDKEVAAVTKPRQLSFKLPNYGEFKKNLQGVADGAKDAANDIKTFYQVAKYIPGTGGQIREVEEKLKAVGTAAAQATELVSNNTSTTKALGNASKAAASQLGVLINQFAKFSIILYGVKESIAIVTGTFKGFFDETIGRAAKFQQTLLKTQTTLASTNRVIVGGKEITDPLEKIEALTATIGDRVESIRQRSIDLAGVTSNDVVEVFGLVASQISQINGDLQDAEDLAINFAAALGTFGIPLYQARQEIGSILRADITVDSYLAKALGITNEDIQRAKTQTDGVVGYIQKKLASAVAGQTLAAKGLEGVLSNIRDIYELIAQAIGEPLLDPVIKASTAIYNILFKSKDLLTQIGNDLGGVLSGASAAIANAFKFEGGKNPIAEAIGNQTPAVITAIRQDVEGLSILLFDTLTRVGDAIRTIFTSIAALSGTAIKAMRELLEALLEISLLKFESLSSALATVAQGITPILQGVTQLIRLWAEVLKIPIVQYFSQIAVTFAVLKATGVIAIAAIVTQLILWTAKWKMLIAKAKAGAAMIQTALKTIFKILGSILILLTKAIAGIRTMLGQSGGNNSKTIRELKRLELELMRVGRSAKGAAFNFRTLGAATAFLGRTLVKTIVNFIKANAVIIGVTLAITLAVDAWGRYTRAVEEARQAQRNSDALDKYIENMGKLSRELTRAEEAEKAFQIQAANQEFDEATAKIRKYKEEIKELEETIKNGGGFWGEGEFGPIIEDGKIREAEKKIAEYEKRLEKALIVLNKDQALKDLQTIAEKRKGMEKEIANLRRQLQNDLFQQEQAVRRKQLEVMRAEAQIVLNGIERRNRKLIEGEEGASRVALEAFNRYIRDKTSRELSLKQQEKSLTIEILNLEKLAIDYRFETEKKIAELRRRVGENEVKAAEAAYKVKTGQAAAGAGLATFGETGRVNNGDPNWVHGHFQTNTGTQMDLINDVKPIMKALAEQGVPMELGYSTGIALDNNHILGPNGDRYLERMINKGLALHSQRGSGDGRSFDLFVPKGTRVPAPLSDISANTGNGGIKGTLPGSGRTWVGHLAPGSKSGAAPMPSGQEDLNIPDATEQADAFAAQVDKVKALSGALLDLSKNLAALQNQDQLDAFLDQAFPLPQIEATESELKRLTETAQQVAESGMQLNSAQAALLENNKLVRDAKREFDQVREGINESTDATDQEKLRAIEMVNEREKKHLEMLEKQLQLKLQIGAAQDLINVTLQMQGESERLNQELAELQLQTRMQMEGFAQQDIALELRKFRLTEQFAKLIKKNPALAATLTAELQKQLGVIEQIAKVQKDMANPLNQLMAGWKRDLNDVNGYYARMAQIVQQEVGTAMSSALIGVIEGTQTVQEAMANMFKNIGRAFIEMATQMIAKAIVMKALGILMPGAATPTMGGGGYFNPLTGLGTAGPNFGLAEGGYVAGPTQAIIGEGGEPEYVIPESKMDDAMSRWSSGSKGSSVLDPSTKEGSGAFYDEPFTPNINITGGVMNFGGEEFIRRDEIPGIVMQAAKAGEERSFRKMKMSPSTRRKIGI